MLKFQVVRSSGGVHCSAFGGGGSSACSSPSLSSFPSSSPTSACSQQRLSQISVSSSSIDEEDSPRQRKLENLVQTCPKFASRRRLSSSPSPSLPDSLPPPLSLLAPPIPPKPASLKSTTSSRSKSSERSGKRSGGELGPLRIYTGQIKPDMDYKTLRVAPTTTTDEVIRQLVEEKLRLSLRDLNLFHLFMELRTLRRADGGQVRSILELDANARPLELQRCHPEGMSRFILGMDSNAILARIYDGEVCPESNYKSVFISRRTTCAQVLAMLQQMCRLGGGARKSNGSQMGIEAISELRLFVQSQTGGSVEALIPAGCCLAGVYLSLLPGQKIVLRRVIVPRSDGF